MSAAVRVRRPLPRRVAAEAAEFETAVARRKAAADSSATGVVRAQVEVGGVAAADLDLRALAVVSWDRVLPRPRPRPEAVWPCTLSALTCPWL